MNEDEGISEEAFAALMARVSALAPLLQSALPLFAPPGDGAPHAGPPPDVHPPGGGSFPGGPPVGGPPHDGMLPPGPPVGGPPPHGGPPPGGRPPHGGQREALLRALKPYLSPGRREAVDYLIRLGRIADTVRTFL